MKLRWRKKINSTLYIYKLDAKKRGDDIINALIDIFISTVQEKFLEKSETSQFYIFFIFSKFSSIFFTVLAAELI